MAKKTSNWTLARILYVSIFVIAVGAAGYFLWKYLEIRNENKSVNEATQKVVDEKMLLKKQYLELSNKNVELEQSLEEANAQNMVNEVHVERLSKENEDLRQILDEYAASMQNIGNDLSKMAQKSQELQARYKKTSQGGGEATADNE